MQKSERSHKMLTTRLSKTSEYKYCREKMTRNYNSTFKQFLILYHVLIICIYLQIQVFINLMIDLLHSSLVLQESYNKDMLWYRVFPLYLITLTLYLNIKKSTEDFIYKVKLDWWWSYRRPLLLCHKSINRKI